MKKIKIILAAIVVALGGAWMIAVANSQADAYEARADCDPDFPDHICDSGTLHSGIMGD